MTRDREIAERLRKYADEWDKPFTLDTKPFPDIFSRHLREAADALTAASAGHQAEVEKARREEVAEVREAVAGRMETRRATMHILSASPEERANSRSPASMRSTLSALASPFNRTRPMAKPSHVGAPAIFALNQACASLNAAFGEAYGCYLVGSAIERADWRDIDVRMVLDDDEFRRLFPAVPSIENASWEHDPRWQWMTISIADRLSKLTGLPVDFQFQPRTFATKRHEGPRHALGLTYAPPLQSDAENRSRLTVQEAGER